MDNSDAEKIQPDNEAPRPVRRNVRPAVLRWGCLCLLLFMCGGVSALGLALRSGPVTVAMPGDGQLKIGSSSTVLSNATFQTGITYFVDLNGGGVRNILELNYLEDSHSIEIVLHHATKQDRDENHLLYMKLP